MGHKHRVLGRGASFSTGPVLWPGQGSAAVSPGIDCSTLGTEKFLWNSDAHDQGHQAKWCMWISHSGNFSWEEDVSPALHKYTPKRNLQDLNSSGLKLSLRLFWNPITVTASFFPGGFRTEIDVSPPTPLSQPIAHACIGPLLPSS